MKGSKNIKDLTGQRFGRLTVIGLHPTETRKTYWACQCDCGNAKVVRSDSLQSGAIRSCGCLKKEQDRENLEANHSHKMSGTRIYGIWQGMKGRCYNPHDARYDRYGGRGITVCNEWKDSFEAFYEWTMANGYSENLTIDRKDNDKGYSPLNCRWATSKEQSNNRSTNISITIGNATKSLTEWCEIFDLDFKTVVSRYNRNGFIGIDELFNRG
jgi:hypothetical protein